MKASRGKRNTTVFERTFFSTHITRRAFSIVILLALVLPGILPIRASVYPVPISAESGSTLALTLEESILNRIGRILGVPTVLAMFAAGDKTKRAVSTSVQTRDKRVIDVVSPLSQTIPLRAGEAVSLTGIPIDEYGDSVDGVPIRWNSKDGSIAKVSDGNLVGLKVGQTVLTAHAGKLQKEFHVTVNPPAHSTPIQDEDESIYRTRFTPQDNLGTPTGQTEAQAPSKASVMPLTERPGSSSFSFDLNLASIPGRGSSASVNMSYNSRLWSVKNFPFDSGRYVYDQDADWLAPGFKLSFGELKRLDYYNFSLTSPNGTRHQMHYVSGNNVARTYESADGTFIRLDITADSSTGIINSPAYIDYPDGSRAVYTKINSTTFVPTMFTDSNGNITEVAYVGSTRKIWYVKDTLGRFITFNYDSNGKLVTITVPGIGEAADRQTIRFYYDTITFDTTTDRFEGDITTHTVPATASVLRYVYFPGNRTGYKYDYSPAWGMIYKISNLRDMQVSSTSLTSLGSVTSEGQVAATTEYNYPLALSAPLTDVPAFTTRTDDWLGRTTASAPVTQYSVNENTTAGRKETRITSPDGTVTESWAKINEFQWDDGLITDVFVKTVSTSGPEVIWSHVKNFWSNQSTAPGRKNIRISKVETTNEAAQTRAITLDYDTYNNQTRISEHDFANPGELGAELRRTEITYETSSNWTSRRLINLTKSVKTFVGTTAVSRTEYEYDGEPLVQYGIDPITQHSSYISPYRGNVTKVTAFADPSDSTDPDRSITTTKYDVTGNVIETGANCCKERKWEYSSANHYAYPLAQEDGDAGQLESTFSYDFDTGLLLSSTDHNSQTTAYTYDEETLRSERIDLPNGAWTTTEYNDQAFPYHVKTTTSLDQTRSVYAMEFYNGAGQGFRRRSPVPNGYISSDIEFDNMGRPFISYNPYTVAGLTDSRPSGIKSTVISEFDPLGRALETTFQDNTTASVEFNGTVVISTDQAGKQRRQIADALGRVTRVDEPIANDELGSVASPNQPTYYEYDVNDNLTKVTQSDGTSTQERLFKYDGLSRLTHEKQVEANATLNASGMHVGGSGSWTGVYKYNTDSLLVEAFDARGVKAAYSYDGLNRISTVTYTGETGYQTPQLTYTYDEIESNTYNKGRLTKVRTAAVSSANQQTPETIQNYRYNKVGSVIKHTQSIGSESYLQEYGYNLAESLVSQKYPSGRVVETEIDNFGRTASVSDQVRDFVTGITYNDRGLVSQMSFANFSKETFTYNDRLQMESQSLNRTNNEVLKKFDYSYGSVDLASGTVDGTKNNGQLAKVESWIGANKQASQRFGYDELGRLKDAREYRGDNNSLTYRQVFDHDRFGNLYRKASSNPTTGQANPLPFTPIESSDIDRTKNRFSSNTTYDDAGQVITESKFREMGFAYDGNGRTVKATKTSTPDAWTVYDALGNRVATKVNDIWNLSIYDAFGKLVAEYGVPTDGPGGLKYVQHDWQGSIRTVVNKAAFVVSRTDHQAFGEEIASGVGLRTAQQGFGNATGATQGYALTEKDAASGQQHTSWRKAEAEAGRWTSPDPYKGSMQISDPRTFNRYSYVENDPINGVDPSGLCTVQSNQDGSERWLGWDCYVTTYGSSGGVVGGGGVGGFFGRQESGKCYGSSCGGGGGPSLGECPPGPSVCEANERDRESKERRYSQLMKSAKDARQRQDQKNRFDDCLKNAMAAAKATVGAILAGGTGTGVKDYKNATREPGGATRSWRGQGDRAIVLYIMFKALQLYEPEFNRQRDAAIADCRSKTGYAGPITDGRPLIFRPAAEVLF